MVAIAMEDMLQVAQVLCIDNYIIAQKYQFMVVHFDWFGKTISTLTMGNSRTWAEDYINRAKINGAIVCTHNIRSTSQFELIANKDPVMHPYHFNWEKIAEKM